MAATNVNHLGQPIGEPVPGWQPRPVPPKTAMTGRYCRVEPLDPDQHGADLWETISADQDGRNFTYLFTEPFTDFDSYNEWLHKIAAGADPMFHAIVDIRDEKAVGLASFMRIEPTMGVIEVGNINFSPRLQRTPLATESMFLMMRRVFDELGYRRYEWKCDSLNAPSRAAAARLGFQFEGIFRQAVVYKGRNRDTAWFSIIDKEWPALKTAFERWLDPANFDPSGQQRERLSALMGSITAR